MLHDMLMEYNNASTERWLEQEFLTWRWFVVLGVIAAVYVVWFILLDKKRAVRLLLLGSLAAVAYSFNSLVVADYLGLVEYVVRLMPVTPNLLFSSVTLCPIILMLVQQYTSTWRGYFLWAAVGLGALSLGLFSFYTWQGIVRWYYGYTVWIHYAVLFTVAVGVRLVYLWIAHTQERSQAKERGTRGGYSAPRAGAGAGDNPHMAYRLC